VIFTALMRGSAGWVTESGSQRFRSQPSRPSRPVSLCASVSQAKRVVKKGSSFPVSYAMAAAGGEKIKKAV